MESERRKIKYEAARRGREKWCPRMEHDGWRGVQRGLQIRRAKGGATAEAARKALPHPWLLSSDPSFPTFDRGEQAKFGVHQSANRFSKSNINLFSYIFFDNTRETSNLVEEKLHWLGLLSKISVLEGMRTSSVRCPRRDLRNEGSWGVWRRSWINWVRGRYVKRIIIEKKNGNQRGREAPYPTVEPILICLPSRIQRRRVAGGSTKLSVPPIERVFESSYSAMTGSRHPPSHRARLLWVLGYKLNVNT